jgi:hypothetical protein
MLKAAVDESGSDDRSSVLCVACCLATARQWRRFSNRWYPYAAKYPKGYHATKARDSDNEALAGIMEEELTAALAITINYQDVKAIVPDKLRGRFGEEYATCIRAVVMLLQNWCEKHNERWVALVLESGHRGQSAANNYIESILPDPYWHIWSHTWARKEELVTHPADLVAHVIATSFARKPSPLVGRIRKAIVHRHFTEGDLKEMVEHGERTVREYERRRDSERAKRKSSRRGPTAKP